IAIFSVSLLDSLTGTPQRRPVGIPLISPPLPFSAWAEYARANLPVAAKDAAILIGSLTAAVMLIALVGTFAQIITKRLRAFAEIKTETRRMLLPKRQDIPSIL